MDLIFLKVKDFRSMKMKLKKPSQKSRSKKTSDIETIPPKLVKLLINFLNPLLTKVINTSIK